MSDWQLGDLALCVRGGRGHKLVARIGDHFYLENGDRTLRVQSGKFYTVTNLGNLIGPERSLALGFKESAGPWRADRFRKVSPHTPDVEDEVTIQLLTTKRTKERV